LCARTISSVLGGQRVHGGAARLVGQAQCAGRNGGHQIGVGDRREIHIPDAVGELVGDLARDLNCQPGFAYSASAGQSHQPVLGHQIPHLGQLRVAAYKAGQLRWKMLGNNSFRFAQRWEVVDQIRVA
jgi:hypothetical protein